MNQNVQPPISSQQPVKDEITNNPVEPTSSSQSQPPAFKKKSKLKLFIGGISKSVTLEQYRKYFEQFGEIEEIFLVKKKNEPTHKGFGFLLYKDADIAQSVMDGGPHQLPEMTKPLTVSTATIETKRFFVGGLKKGVTDKESLNAYFGK
eukprot:UN25795